MKGYNIKSPQNVLAQSILSNATICSKILNIWYLLFGETLIRVNLKFGVNPNSERKVEKIVATELK